MLVGFDHRLPFWKDEYSDWISSVAGRKTENIIILKKVNLIKNECLKLAFFTLSFCMCWGFTAQLTQWGNVERGQFT